MTEAVLKPDVIDNRDLTLADALAQLGTRSAFAEAPFDIATGFVNLGGLEAVASFLESSQRVRIMLGAEPESPLVQSGAGTPIGLQVRQGLAELESLLAEDRDRLPFNASTARNVLRVAELLRRPTVEVRRYSKRFLHGKVYLFRGEGVIAGSHNLTGAGLRHNLEFALGTYDSGPIRQTQEWFDKLWADADEYKQTLIDVLAARDLQAFNPYEIYLRALLEIYQPELELLASGDAYDPGQPGGLQLAEFQEHGFQRALRIINRFDGVMVADGVGLGKSFIGTRMLNHFTNTEGVRALVVVPASLRDSFWERWIKEQDILAQVVSYQQLADIKELGGTKGDVLYWPKDSIRFVLVDEAHAFRNPDTKQYRALSRLMGGTRKRLCMMTATPVNNSLLDLYHQVMLFARHTARFRSIGIPDLHKYFKKAQEATLDGGGVNATFALMDAISVRRTRRFIQKHYPNAKINGEIVRFPIPTLRTRRYDLDAAFPGLFELVADRMENGLSFARYQPDGFRIEPGHEDARAVSLAGLLRTGLLKRFESSAASFRSTCQTMLAAHARFLEALEKGLVLVPEDRVDLVTGLDEDADPAEQFALDRGEASNPASLYKQKELRAAVELDMRILGEFLTAVDGLSTENDPKLDALSKILTNTIGDNGEKVIIFTAYADTANWIEQALIADSAAGGKRFGTREYVCVTGTGTLSADERLRRVHSFSPETTRDITGVGLADGDERDLLVTTDTLAEGHNLQQARHIINFDLPWNPMQLVQRNGRIDRIGSPWADKGIFLFNMFPEGDLDRILRLYEILLRKIGYAHAAVGLEGDVIEGVTAIEQTFAETKDQIRAIADEDGRVLEEAEDLLDAFSGEEFRMELRNAIAQGIVKDLQMLPHGAGSGHMTQAIPKGSVGIFFGVRLLLGKNAKVSSEDQRAWHYVDLSEPESPLTDELEILRRIRCASGTARNINPEAAERIHDVWESLQQSIISTYNRSMDPAESGVQIPPSQRFAISVLTEQTDTLNNRHEVKASRVKEACRALEVPRGNLVQRMLSRQRHLCEDGEQSVAKTALEVLSIVESEGLRPPDDAEGHAVQLSVDRVRLICYEIVESSH